MTMPRELAAEVERRAELPDVPDRERFSGYAVVGLPFGSGDILAMRRFPATSVGPGYTSVWHRDPAGRWVIYQDQKPRWTCPRAFGPAIDDAPTVPISVTWTAPCRFVVDIDAEGHCLHWEVALAHSAVTRALNAVGSAMPAAMRRHPAALTVTGRAAGLLLRAGRVRMRGTVPSGQRFFADLERVWVVDDSTAVLDGRDLGKPGPVREQARLGDFWLPQRGVFAFGSSFFEHYDPARHHLVASRREIGAADRPARAAVPAITLYGLAGSHPSAAVGRALELKGLRFRRRDRLPVLHRLQHRLLFGQGSAPAARIDSRRVVGTMEIMGALDALQPEPPLFPSGEKALRTVQAAHWADRELQAVARRLAWAAMVACPAAVRSVLEGSSMVLPTRLVAALSRPAVLLGARLNGATEPQVRRDLAALPELLDDVDDLLEEGILGDGAPNAAGLQIAATRYGRMRSSPWRR